VGYVDSDAHVYESDAAWDHLDPNEREFRPRTMRDADSQAELWFVSGQLAVRGDRYHPTDDERSHSLYPPGVQSLEDVPARLAHMDRLGVDVQVVFSTFFIRANLPRPMVEAALARSWNRWMAEKHDESGGRIKWALRAPVRMMERAFEEMEFGKEHGAVGVHVQGRMAGMVLDDEYLYPLYAKAQDLDLAMCIHVGHDKPGYSLPDPRYGFEIVVDVPLGFHRLCVSDLHGRFPRLRWGWMEAGASWIPFVLHEAARSNEKSGMTRGRDETHVDTGLLARHNLFVACQMDDDIPYLVRYAGEHNLVLGTDYGHLDVGSDLYAHEIVVERPDLDAGVAQKIVDGNGRALFGIDPSFTPAPVPTLART
jgi:predicted TIM-barrel fold metal-dependent hydrolase